MIAPEHDRRRPRLLERPMQSEALQPWGVGDPREHKMRDAGVDKVEVREVRDGGGLEGGVPGVISLEVGAEGEVCERVRICVEDGADFAHVREPVVVLRPEREFAEPFEGGYADGVEVPPAFELWREQSVLVVVER